jgi:predicted alpha/beta superfamily hydrolase
VRCMQASRSACALHPTVTLCVYVSAQARVCVCVWCYCRSDAAQWPGGGVDNYLARVQQEVLPWVAREYGASLAPADLALAGSSFGGVAALCAGMSGASLEAGCAFSALLVESPSMWIANEGFLRVSGNR